jgi:hypothetical protein
MVESVGLHKTMKALVASDHLPLYADFAVKEANLKEHGASVNSDQSSSHTERL